MSTSFLEFLTQDDHLLFSERASRRLYAADQVILREGGEHQGISVILRGRVRVEREYLGQSVPVAHLCDGEVFGEMSLVEEGTVSASVVAEEETEVEFIAESDIQELLESVPGLEARFYRSLALLLSRRLRETTGQVVPPFSWGQGGVLPCRSGAPHRLC